MSTATPSGAPAPASARAVTATAPATGGAPAALVTAQPLPVSPGQALAARVLTVQAGMVELALAGGVVTAASDLPLEPGQTLRLVVGEAGDDRVTLRVQPDGAAGTGAGARGTPGAALAAAGVPPAAAAALLAALAEAGGPPPTGAAATALAAGAAAAGVATPAGAAAFARLAAAGLPTTPAAVAGLATLLEGAPLGRALATLLDGAAATRSGVVPPASAPASGAAAAPLPGTPAGAMAAPDGGTGANWTSGSRPSGASSQTPLLMPVPGQAANWTSEGGPIAASPVAGAPAATTAAAATAATADARQLTALVAALATLTRGVGADATSGSAELLRRAIADLGGGLEARLAAGHAPEAAPLRALLHALANHPAADAALARSAAGIADGLTAQGLAGATIPPAGAAAPDPAQQGAYLQVPLPGGGTAEVRVSPDGRGDGPDGDGRPRKLAFLLHLSALGPVMIEATAGRAGVDATIRVNSDEVRSFLAPLTGELAAALRRGAPTASVSVERVRGPVPERLLAPPPSSGLDLTA